MTTVTLIDLSSIIYPLWHMAASDPNPNATSLQTLDRIHALSHGQPTVAIAIDSKTSIRRELEPSYKAQRKGEDRATLYHQMDLVIETLKKEGYPVWTVAGYEADDVIASATALALAVPETTVQIVSADKDLLALVSDHVVIKSLKDGSLIDAEVVKAKFGVRPDQIPDYLCLVGDASDNIKGADKIGPVTAVKLLGAYGSLEGIYKAWHANPDTFTPAIQASLDTFAPRVDEVRNLVRLRADLAIPFAEIAAERPTPSFDAAPEDEADPFGHDTPTGLPVPPATPPTTTQAPEPVQASPATPTAFTGPVAVPAPKRRAPRQASPQAPIDVVVEPPPAPAVQTAPVVEPAPAPEPVKPAAPPKAMEATKPMTALAVIDADYSRQLEPTSLPDAIQLAKYAFESRLFGAYGSPQGVLMTIMAGREMGMATMHSLRAFHVIDGKPVLAADAIRALVMRSGLVDYFRCTERTAERATFAIKRKGDPEVTLSYSIQEAQAAGLVKPGSGYTKNPADLLVARAGSKIARLVCPDVIHGIYAPEEME
jgi:5'-3' exonuclease